MTLRSRLEGCIRREEDKLSYALEAKQDDYGIHSGLVHGIQLDSRVFTASSLFLDFEWTARTTYMGFDSRNVRM